MRAVILLMFAAYASSQVTQNVCKPYEIVFILDHSENAKKASTNEGAQPFHLLTTAWNNYMTELQQAGDSLFQIWTWAYSSTATPKQLVVRGTRPSQAMNPTFGSVSSGGSWTYMGIDQLKNQYPNPNLNNLVIIISAQGSMNAVRRNLASASYAAIRANGWNTYVIGVKSSPTIDAAELTAVNGGQAPVIVDDGAASNKKSYSRLGSALTAITNTYFCTATVVTVPPTQPPYVPSTGICSNCKVLSGYGFDRHPTLCDAFYQCLADKSYILKYCGESLIWDDQKATCVKTDSFACPSGACSAALKGRLYASGVCCNEYFSCNGQSLVYLRCPVGQIFDVNSQGCVYNANPTTFCIAKGSSYCGIRTTTVATDCRYYAPDPTGDPCKYVQLGPKGEITSKAVPAGTTWDQTKCALVKSEACSTSDVFNNRALSTTSNVCTATLISDWDSSVMVYSQRNATLQLGSAMPNVTNGIIGGRLMFQQNTNNSIYYFFFSKNEISQSSAFRVVFTIPTTIPINVMYDLFSNNFCEECPATVSVAVRRISSTTCVITSSFLDAGSGSKVQTSTTVQDNGSQLDLVLIWGPNDVHGRIKLLGGAAATIPIAPVWHTAASGITSNQCGIVVGAGPNNPFLGSVDLFAFYKACLNIEDVMLL